MAAKSNNQQPFSILSTGGTYGRVLVASLSTIVLLVALARGYLFLQFRSDLTDAVAGMSKSSQRNSLILSCYQLVLDSYALAERGVHSSSERVVLDSVYLQKTDAFKFAKAKYETLLEQIIEKPVAMQPTVDRFFLRIDTLLSKTDLVFYPRKSLTGKTRLTTKPGGLIIPGIDDYFRRLRRDWEAVSQLELELNSQEFSRGEQFIRLSTERWFAVSGVLLVFALALAVVVVMIAGRATSLIRQLSIVLENNVDPIEIADPSGKVLYVNSEFERWSGRKKNDLIGSACFSGLSVNNGKDQEHSVWEAIQDTVKKGEAWTGDVEVRQADGSLFDSSLIAFPMFDRRGRLWQIIGLHHDTSERKRLTQKVEETREQYQSLVESSLDGIVVVQDDKLVFANPSAVRTFKYGSQEVMTRLNFSATIAPASRPFLHMDYEKKEIGEDLLKNYEMKGLTMDGKLIDLEINARVILWNGKPALHASFRDITERKALERQQAIWLWEQETLSSIDRQLVGIVDLQKVLDIILQQVILLTRAQFVGVTMVDPLSQNIHWRVAKGNRTPLVGNIIRVTPGLAEMLSGAGHTLVEDCRINGSFQNSDLPSFEQEQLISLGFFPVTVNGVTRGRLVVGFRQPHEFPEREIRVLTSMAEKVSIALTGGELYEDLLRREKELELLSGARVQAQEDERRRISREIHDGLGQMLTAIKFNLEILEDGITVQEEEKKRIADIKQLLDNTVKEAREISYNLMPSVLDDFGLAPGLQSLCEQFSKGSELRVTFHAHGLTERLTPEVETGVYRIAQEALNNIAKHAGAKEVEVQIVKHADRLRLTVEDDGIGMNVLPAASRSLFGGGTGLVGMRERASSFNGTLVIDSTPGKGSTIDVEIPLPVS